MGNWECLHVGIISSEVVGLEFLFKANSVSVEWPGHWIGSEVSGMPFTQGTLPTPVCGEAIFHQSFLFVSGYVYGLSHEFLLCSEIKALIRGWENNYAVIYSSTARETQRHDSSATCLCSK